VLCFAAAIFCIIQCALVWSGVIQGNGKNIDLLDSKHLEHVQKIQYATDIFYIVILYLSRASIIFLLERLQGLGLKPIWKISFAVLSLWFVASVFAVALKCDLSQPWIEYNAQCSGLLQRWQAIEILGIITECAMFSLAVHLVYIGRMSMSSRVKILLLFSTRALVIVFSALRITSLSDYYHSQNPTYAGIPAAIYALAEANSSVITTTTPLLKAFVLQFTWMNTMPPAPAKPHVVQSGVASAPPASHEPALGSRHGSNLSEHEKPTAASSSGGEARPGTGENALLV